MSEHLINAIAEMDEEQTLASPKRCWPGAQTRLSFLDDCRAAMEIVGKRFEEGMLLHPRADIGRRNAQRYFGRSQTLHETGRRC